MKTLAIALVAVAGCVAPAQIQTVQGGGVSHDGRIAWFGVVESRGESRRLRIYQCDPGGCLEVRRGEAAAGRPAPAPETPEPEPERRPSRGMDGAI